MDNLTHTLCGALLAKTRLGKLSPLAPAALLIGANLPDADIVVALFGGDAMTRRASYLLHHRGITHSLLGIAAQALLLAAAVRFIERRELERSGERALAWRCHLLPALAGLLTHPLLDWLNNYGVRPFLPFSDRRLFGDLVFIVDPWLWLLLGGTAALTGARTRLGHWAWGLLTAVATAVLVLHERTPLHVRIAFPPLVALLAWARARGVGRAMPRRTVAIGAALIAGYLGVLGACGRLAVARATVDPALAPQFRMRSPALADPLHWSAAFDDGTTLRWRRVAVFGEGIALAPATSARGTPGGEVTLGLDDPLVAFASARPEAAAWRAFARLPWGWLDLRADGSAAVHLSDARYLTRRDPDEWCVLTIELSAVDVAAARRAIPVGN